MNKPDIQDAIARIRILPTLPTVLTQIFATAADPNASAVDLGQHIASDQSLSATLLKLVNSAYYGYYRQINSITKAIVILGFNEVRNLALTATAFRNFPRGHPDFDRTQLWRHSVATAMAAERLAKTLQLDLESCFIAGLLHDIGKVVLDVLFTGQYLAAVRKAHAEGKFIRETEMEVFETSHAEAGGMLGDHWNLPPPVVECIRYHHAPENAVITPQLTNLIALANFITYQAGLGEFSNGRDAEFPESSAMLNVSERQWSVVCEDLLQSHDRINGFLGALPH